MTTLPCSRVAHPAGPVQLVYRAHGRGCEPAPGEWRELVSWKPEQSSKCGVNFESDVEQTVLRSWEEVLGVNGIAKDADFFQLGGHSLTASQITSRIKRDLNVDVTLSDFFEMPTVTELTEFVLRAIPEMDPVAAEQSTAADGERSAPLSPALQRR